VRKNDEGRHKADLTISSLKNETGVYASEVKTGEYGSALRKTGSSRKVDKCSTVFGEATLYTMVVWERECALSYQA
jgi:hypothetical protein